MLFSPVIPSFSEEEEHTEGIDLSTSCSFPLHGGSQWKLSVKGDETARRERLHDSLDLRLLGWQGFL